RAQRGDGGDLTLAQHQHTLGVGDDRGDVGGDVVLLVAQADDQRGVEPRADQELGVVAREHRQRVGAADALEGGPDRGQEVALVVGLRHARPGRLAGLRQLQDGYPRGVVAPVLEAFEALHEDRRRFTAAEIPDDPAHSLLPLLELLGRLFRLAAGTLERLRKPSGYYGGLGLTFGFCAIEYRAVAVGGGPVTPAGYGIAAVNEAATGRLLEQPGCRG